MTTSMVRFKKKTKKTVIYAKISTEMVNLRDLAGNRVEEDLLVVCFLLCYFKTSQLTVFQAQSASTLTSQRFQNKYVGHALNHMNN